MDEITRTRLLQEAEGYFELGMQEECQRTLAALLPEDQRRREVLALRLAMAMTGRSWDAAAEIASCLVEQDPQNANWWVNFAFCVRRARSIDEAEAILLRAEQLHPDVAVIQYNLACYACVTGRLQEARERFLRARKIDKSVEKLAAEDEDLFALRDWITSGDWKSVR
jgi:Flp pilus assembly protein TadD